MRIAFVLNDIVEHLNNCGELQFQFDFLNFVSAFSSFDSITELKYHFFLVFEKLINQVEERNQYKHEKTIEVLKQIAQNNFSDEGLCLDILADEVGLSTIYLGRLFKKITFLSFSEYLTNIRLDKAATYILETNKTLDEIVLHSQKFY